MPALTGLLCSSVCLCAKGGCGVPINAHLIDSRPVTELGTGVWEQSTRTQRMLTVYSYLLLHALLMSRSETGERNHCCRR